MEQQKEAVTDLQNELQRLKNEVQSCCSSGSKIKSIQETDDQTTTTTTKIAIEETAVLYQNNPNPFSSSTIIEMRIPASVKTAVLAIYDLTGRQLKAIQVEGRNMTSYSFSSHELVPGTYHYSLLIDGSVADTKTMVITE